VDHRGRTLLRNASGQFIVDGVDVGIGRPAPRIAGRLVVGVPTAQLAADVAVLAAQIPQAYLVRVSAMNLGQRVDQRQAGVPAAGCIQELLGFLLATGDDPVDEAMT
jgi:hypothetical protein